MSCGSDQARVLDRAQKVTTVLKAPRLRLCALMEDGGAKKGLAASKNAQTVRKEVGATQGSSFLAGVARMQMAQLSASRWQRADRARPTRRR